MKIIPKEKFTLRFKMPVYIIGGREHRHHKCEDGRVLMMRKVKSRKEYYCDDCNQTIKKGDQYFCLDMSPGQYYQLYESFDHENLSIIKRACVRCVEKEFVEGRTASEMEKEESILRLLENKSLSLTEARA